MKIPSFNEMRNTYRKSQALIERHERMEKRQKRRLTLKRIVSIVILMLIVVPIRSEEANLIHGIITWCAIALYVVLNLSEWRSYAPLTRWRRAKVFTLTTGLTLLIIPLVLLLLQEHTPEKLALYYFMWLGAGLLLIGYVVATLKKRHIKAEASYNAEQIRRREQRRKKLEIL